jgi:hypothetical protein
MPVMSRGRGEGAWTQPQTTHIAVGVVPMLSCTTTVFRQEWFTVQVPVLETAAPHEWAVRAAMQPC